MPTDLNDLPAFLAFFYCPGRRHRPAPLRAFVDFIKR